MLTKEHKGKQIIKEAAKKNDCWTCFVKTIKECPALQQILESWASRFNVHNNCLFFNSSGFLRVQVLDSGPHMGQTILEITEPTLDFREWCEICELIKYRGSVWIVMDCTMVASYPWAQYFAVFMTRFCPKDDPELEGSHMFKKFSADLWTGAKHYYWFYFEVTFQESTLDLIAEISTNGEMYWKLKSHFHSRFLEEFGPGELQGSPFKRGFTILPPVGPDHLPNDDM
jgi:hypothetical protein